MVSPILVKTSPLLLLLLVALTYLMFMPTESDQDSDSGKVAEKVQISPTKTSGEDCKDNFDFKGRDQEDPELIAYIRTLLIPPSVKAYNLKDPKNKYYSFEDHCKFVDDLHGPGRRHGFFIEAGGYDGESGSLPLFLERDKGFSGILVEANPQNFKTLLSKERKAFSINAALSPTNTSGELSFSGSGQQGKISDQGAPSTIKVKAFPLYSILKAMGVDFVDVFCLDIEGFEFKALKTIPWDKMKFGIVTVEHLNIPEPHEEVVKYMENLGYRKVLQNQYDWMFVDPNYEKKSKEGKQ